MDAWPLPFEGGRQALADPRAGGGAQDMPDGLGFDDAVAFVVSRLPARFGNQRPRMLVDGLEQLDAGSRKVVEHLAIERTADILAVAAAAPSWADGVVEVGPVDDLPRWLAEVLRDPAMAARLATEGVERFGANPAAVLDWIEDAMSAGTLVPHPSAWRLNGPMPEIARRPPVPDEARGLATALRLWGGPMPLAALLAADDASGDTGDFNQRLEALVDADIIEIRDDHAIVRGPAALRQIRPSNAVGVATRLLTVAPPSPRRTVLLAEADDPALVRAEGPSAVAAFALTDAERAADLAGMMESTAPGARITAARVRALLRASAPAAALAAAHHSLSARARTPDDAVLLGEIAAISLDRGDLPQAERAIESGLELLAGAAPPLSLLFAVGRLHMIQRDPRAVIASAGPALRAPPPPEDADLWGRFALLVLEALERIGSPEQAADLLAHVSTDAVRGPVGVRLATAAARALASRGDLDGAALRLDDAVRAAAAIGSGTSSQDAAAATAELLHERAALRSRLGDRLEAMRAWHAAARAWEHAGDADRAAEANLALAGVHRSLGWFAEADRLAKVAADRGRTRELVTRARTAHALTAADRGAWAEASEVAAASRQAGDPEASVLIALAAALDRAPDAATLADAARAAAASPSLRAIAEVVGRIADPSRRAPPLLTVLTDAARTATLDDMARLRRFAAEAAHRAGDPGEAAAHIEQAMALAAECNNLTELQAATKAHIERRAPAALSLADVVVEVGRIGRLRGLDGQLDAIAAGALQLTPYERVFIMRSGSPGQPPVARAARTRTGANAGHPPKSFITRVLRAGAVIHAPRVDAHPILGTDPDLTAAHAASVVGVPLRSHDTVVGVLYLQSSINIEPDPVIFSTIRALATLAESAFDASAGLSGGATEAARSLREPLGDMLIATSQLRALAAGRPSATKTLDGITAATRHVLDSVRRLSADDAQSVRVDLARLTLTVAVELAPSAVERGVRIELHLAPTADIEGDPAQLVHLLTTIITHAVRYTAAGDVVEVALTADNERVTWTVRDRGTAVPGADLPVVFQDPTPQTGPGGATRSPLAAAGAVARRFGGSLALGQRPAGGAVVRVDFPRVREP